MWIYLEIENDPLARRVREREDHLALIVRPDRRLIGRSVTRRDRLDESERKRRRAPGRRVSHLEQAEQRTLRVALLHLLAEDVDRRFACGVPGERTQTRRRPPRLRAPPGAVSLRP